MAETRIRVISDRLFHKLWDYADEYEDVHKFIFAFTDENSEKKINFQKYKIDYIQACDLLKAIYEIKNKSIAELLNENNIKPIEISHRFCIPIRTLENWMSEKRTPPDYVKLMIIGVYDIKFLPPFIYTESGNKERTRYKEHDNEEKKDKKKTELDLAKDDEFDFDDIDRRINSFKTEKINISSPDILISTSYLDEIIKNR